MNAGKVIALALAVAMAGQARAADNDDDGHGTNVEAFGLLLAVAAYAEADCPGVLVDRHALDESRRAFGIRDADGPTVERAAKEVAATVVPAMEAAPLRWCVGAYDAFGKGGRGEAEGIRPVLAWRR